MAELTSQCPCAQRMRLPPRLPGETRPSAGTLVVCVYCERVGVANTRQAYARTARAADIPAGERTRLNQLRDQAQTRFPKRRRRALP